MPRASTQSIILKLTAKQASTNFGIDHESLRRKIQRADLRTGPGVKYTIKEIVAAVYGDKEFEQTRKIAAEADIAEMEREEKAGRMVDMSIAKEMISTSLLPMVSILNGMPKATAPKANPSDPQTAELAIKESCDNLLKQVQSKVGKKIVASKVERRGGKS